VSNTSGPKPGQPHPLPAALGSSGLGPWLDDAPLMNAPAPAEAAGDRTRPTAPPRTVPSGPVSQRLEGLLRTVAPSAVTVSATDYPDLHAAMVISDADGSTYTIAAQQLHAKVHLSTMSPDGPPPEVEALITTSRLLTLQRVTLPTAQTQVILIRPGGLMVTLTVVSGSLNQPSSTAPDLGPLRTLATRLDQATTDVLAECPRIDPPGTRHDGYA